MAHTLTLNDRRFHHGTAARIAGVALRDLKKWQDPTRRAFELGEMSAGRRTYSAMEIATLRIVSALCGPAAGATGRQFMAPAVAFGTVSLIGPLERFVEVDDEGYLKEPGPVLEQRFMVVRVQGQDQHSTVDVLDGGEVAARLGAIDNQMMIVPLTRILFEVVTECGETFKGDRKLAADLQTAFKKAGLGDAE